MGIVNISKFLKGIGATDIYELVNQAAKKSIRHAYGKIRCSFSGEEMQEFGLEHAFGNLKQPKLVIGGNNTKKGQSVWSAAVCDSTGKPVEVWSIGYDTTRGKYPVFQCRTQVFDGKKKIYTSSEYINSNGQVGKIPDIQTSMTKEKGITALSADIDGVYRYEASAMSPKRVNTFYDNTGFYVGNANQLEHDLKYLQSGDMASDRLKFIKESFKAKTSYAKQRSKLIEKMDLKAIGREIELQLTRLKKQEQALEQLYKKVYGTGENAPNWREEFIEGTVSRINPLTNKQIPAKTIERINKKIKEYSDTRALLLRATARKLIITGSETLDRKYIAKMISETGITVGKTVDKIMIEELKALKGLPKAELMEKAKNIICKRKGLPEDLVDIKPVSDGLNLKPYSACFEETNACLYYHPTIFELPDEIVAGIMRHELDHFEVLAKSAKKIGLENFKIIACRENEEYIKRFNDVQWNKILERITVEDGFNSESYIKALQEYTTPYGSFTDCIKYLSNPLELRAYQAGMDVEVALNNGNIATLAITQLIKSKIGTELQSVLGEIENALGNRFIPAVYGEKLKQKAINSIKDVTTPNFEIEILNEALKIAKRDLVKAKEGNFTGPGIIKAVKAEKISSISKSIIKNAEKGKLKKSVFEDLKKNKAPILLQSKIEKAAKDKASA